MKTKAILLAALTLTNQIVTAQDEVGPKLTEGMVQLAWHQQPEGTAQAEGFKIYLGTDPEKLDLILDVGLPPIKMYEGSESPEHGFLILGLDLDTTYYSRLSAYNFKGESEQSDMISFTANPVPTGPPAKPALLRIVTYESVNLDDWEEILTVEIPIEYDGVKVYRSRTRVVPNE